jgi:hypothetical protein
LPNIQKLYVLARLESRGMLRATDHPGARFSDQRTLEKFSSAFTLSDMEVFLFPELVHALVPANSMSPRIWRWQSDPWFAKIKTMPLARRLQRLKQYIIDHYAFNLDPDTWGLTTKAPGEVYGVFAGRR